MAVLPDGDRSDVHSAIMKHWSRQLESTGTLTKSELRDAVNSTDQWIEDNQGSFNNSLPTNVKDTLTAVQKARLFMMVADRRWEVL
jgi:hypothetical protein